MESRAVAKVIPLRPTTPENPYEALCSPDAEHQLLGIIMHDNRYYEHVADIVTADDFGWTAHARIFEVIGTLCAAGKPANPPTLVPFLVNDEVFASVGGVKSYLTKIVLSVVTRINATGYAEQIADLARRRRIVALAEDTIREIAKPDPNRSAIDVADTLESGLIEIINSGQRGGAMTIGALAQASLMRTQQAYQDGGAVVVHTGIADIDKVLKGMGLGHLVVIGARPAMGKTAMGANILFNAARDGVPGAMFSLEMSADEITQRWIASMTGIPTDKQRHGQIEGDQWQDLVDAQAALEKLPIYVDDQQRLSIGQLRARAKRLKRRYGIRLIVVDYLQLMIGERSTRSQDKRVDELSQITRDLKGIAKELDLVIVALSQLSRAVEQRDDKRPMLSDLRESGSIEQDADTVMLLYREEYYLSNQEPKRGAGREPEEQFAARVARWEDRLMAVRGVAEINIAKQRHGKSSVVKVAWSGGRQRFSDLYRGEAP